MPSSSLLANTRRLSGSDRLVKRVDVDVTGTRLCRLADGCRACTAPRSCGRRGSKGLKTIFVIHPIRDHVSRISYASREPPARKSVEEPRRKNTLVAESRTHLIDGSRQ